MRNLANGVTEEILEKSFSQFGKLERVKKLKDYAFIHFEERDGAVKVFTFCNSVLQVFSHIIKTIILTLFLHHFHWIVADYCTFLAWTLSVVIVEPREMSRHVNKCVPTFCFSQALEEMNGKELEGEPIEIVFAKPPDQKRKERKAQRQAAKTQM